MAIELCFFRESIYVWISLWEALYFYLANMLSIALLGFKTSYDERFLYSIFLVSEAFLLLLTTGNYGYYSISYVEILSFKMCMWRLFAGRIGLIYPEIKLLFFLYRGLSCLVLSVYTSFVSSSRCLKPLIGVAGSIG